MDEKKHGITNEGLRNKWFLPVLIIVFVVMGIFYNRNSQTTGELHLAKENKLDEVSSQISAFPLEIYLSVTDYKDGTLTVLISNQSGDEMKHTEEFELEVEADGAWERLTPQEKDNVQTEFYSIADLEEVEIECDLTSYGVLESGHYRLIMDDLITEFTLEK